MTPPTIRTDSAEATQAIGRALASLLRAGDVILLSGDLGAGKTQLVKGLAQGLGVVEPITSPTFNLLLVHEGRLPLYHFDLYRLEDADQLEDLDYFGTLESGGVSAVEWGDRFSEALPADFLDVVLHVTGDTSRALELRYRGDRGRELATEWLDACVGIGGATVEPGASA